MHSENYAKNESIFCEMQYNTKQKVLLGIEPRLADSKSAVITIRP